MTHYHILQTEERAVTVEITEIGSRVVVEVWANKIGKAGDFHDDAHIHAHFYNAIMPYRDQPVTIHVTDPARVLCG